MTGTQWTAPVDARLNPGDFLTKDLDLNRMNGILAKVNSRTGYDYRVESLLGIHVIKVVNCHEYEIIFSFTMVYFVPLGFYENAIFYSKFHTISGLFITARELSVP